MICLNNFYLTVKLVKWCNENNGFMTAILSIVGVLLSFIAIIISIKVAKLPYKKKILLNSFYNVGMGNNLFMPIGLGIEVVNVGNRVINFKYLGYAVKENYRLTKLYSINEQLENIGTLNPAEIKSINYNSSKIIEVLNTKNPNAKLYICANDTEGKTYLKVAGKICKILETLKKGNLANQNNKI